MSGLEYLQGMINGAIDHPPISLLVDFTLVEVEEGRAVFGFKPAEFHLNPFAAVHGGVTAGVIDAATACAVQSMLPAGVSLYLYRYQSKLPETGNPGLRPSDLRRKGRAHGPAAGHRRS